MFSLLPFALLFALMLADMPLCPSRALIGVPCPGCGLTRATFAAAHGDFHGMVHLHPLAPLLTPLLIFSVVRTVLVHSRAIRRDRWDILGKLSNRWWGVFALLIVGLWAARLAGLLGGHPDHVDFSQGYLYRAFASVGSLFG